MEDIIWEGSKFEIFLLEAGLLQEIRPDDSPRFSVILRILF